MQCHCKRTAYNPRHCEAPVSPRYAERYRREAIQCRGDNIRMYRRGTTSTLDCFAAYHQLRIASAMAASQRRAGRKPCPVPAQCAGTVDEGYVRPTQRAGLKPAPTTSCHVPRRARHLIFDI
ncbi:MAG: hypothetical protein LBM98_04700 [Oscillospiraceae bacterium]|nr:hypothetical protein [Oscillospiraceae bacterium]